MAKTLLSNIGRSLFLSTFTVNSAAHLFTKTVPSNRYLLFTGTHLQSNLRHFGANIPTMKSALVLIVDGSEEMEFTIAADVLRRAGVSFGPYNPYKICLLDLG